MPVLTRTAEKYRRGQECGKVLFCHGLEEDFFCFKKNILAVKKQRTKSKCCPELAVKKTTNKVEMLP